MNFDTDKFLKELEILVNMDSGQGNPEGITAVGKYFADRMSKKGWICKQIDIGDKTGKCTIIKNREVYHYDVMLVGHVDTVYPTGETAKRPFRRDESKAYGLGTSDMKQGDLAMLYIMEALPEDICDRLNIVAVFNPDEEIGSIYSKDLIDEYAKISDYAFVFEAASDDDSKVIGRKGIYRARVAFHGKAGHAGNVHMGNSISAINELVYWASKLNKLSSKKRGTTVNIGKISGGEKHNIVSDFAEMDFELRYDLINESIKLENLLKELKTHAELKSVKLEISDELKLPPLVPTEKTLGYIKHLKSMFKSHGITFKTTKRGGFSDANHIAQFGAVCIDGLGPAGSFCHSADEYMDIKSVEKNLKIGYLMICDLAEFISEYGGNR